MKVKHNHLCMLTGKTTTCFVFSEFSLLFALSREAYDQLLRDYSIYESSQDICSFCETDTTVKTLTDFDDSTFFTDIRICPKCYNRIKERIEENT